jgi:hypothetical protein
MKYFVVLFNPYPKRFSTRDSSSQKVSGFIYNDNTKSVLINAIININKVRGARTDANGYFEIDVQPTDTYIFPFRFSITE